MLIPRLLACGGPLPVVSYPVNRSNSRLEFQTLPFSLLTGMFRNPEQTNKQKACTVLSKNPHHPAKLSTPSDKQMC